MTNSYFYFDQTRLAITDSYRQSGNYPAMYDLYVEQSMRRARKLARI